MRRGPHHYLPLPVARLVRLTEALSDALGGSLFAGLATSVAVLAAGAAIAPRQKDLDSQASFLRGAMLAGVRANGDGARQADYFNSLKLPPLISTI